MCKVYDMGAMFNAINSAMTLGFTTWEATDESGTLTSDAVPSILPIMYAISHWPVPYLQWMMGDEWDQCTMIVPDIDIRV